MEASKIIFDILFILIGALISVIGTVLVFQFKGLRGDVHSVAESTKSMSAEIGALNEKVAVLINDRDWQKELNEKFLSDIKRLEDIVINKKGQ